MLKIFKQKTFWWGLGCILLAILTAGIGIFVHPGGKVMDKLQKALNKGDVDVYLECFLPEERDDHTREELSALISEMQFMSGESAKIEVLFFQGEDTVDDSGFMEPYCIYVVKEDDNIVDAECGSLLIQVVDGREYLTDY